MCYVLQIGVTHCYYTVRADGPDLTPHLCFAATFPSKEAAEYALAEIILLRPWYVGGWKIVEIERWNTSLRLRVKR